MLILNVWREACRHPDIADAVESIAAILPPELPPTTLVVRALDREHRRLDTVGASTSGSTEVPAAESTELPPQRLDELVWWCRSGRLARCRVDALPPPLDLVAPAGLPSDVVLGPLLDTSGEPLGVAVLAARAFGAVHEGTIQRLLEPLAVALRNDLRRRALLRAREALEADRAALLARLGGSDGREVLLGGEGGLRTVMDRARQAAGADAPVLLLGELGSGRELIAREIHRRSGRSGGPFLRVSCTALGPADPQPDLFGDVSARTGCDRTGWLQRADGGILYLDEVAALPLQQQGALLQLLDGGPSAGGAGTPRLDVRIIAATAHDPLTLVQEHRMREDLWYRLSTFPIRVPPLRERLEDLPALAARFAREAGERLSGLPLRPTETDLALLAGYGWPGNVRELAAVIERAAILGGGARLEVAAALGRAARPGPPAAGPVEATPVPGVIPLDAAMVRHIEGALRKTRGRVEGPAGAAALLGVNPHTLRSRMRKLGISWGRFRAAVEEAG